jgi:hypothetical protein
MESAGKNADAYAVRDRLRKSWLPIAAAVGAFAGFVSAAFQLRPDAKPVSGGAPVAAESVPPQQSSGRPALDYELQYSKSTIIGPPGSAHQFQRSLLGIAVGPKDEIYGLGDGEIRVFDSGGIFLRSWKALRGASCLTVAADGRVYVGALGTIEIYDREGNRSGGFSAGEAGKPVAVTALKVFRNEILAADADARYIRQFNQDGKQLGGIGMKNNIGNFMLPNRWLDFDIDSKGLIVAADSGRHLVAAWALNGSPLGSFGKFGMTDPAHFVGCCNPVNLALTPDGKVVTAEKMVARVKVYEPGGKLMAVIGPENFDQACTHIYLAVDSTGRILAADPVRRTITGFSKANKAGLSRPLSGEASATDRRNREDFNIL